MSPRPRRPRPDRGGRQRPPAFLAVAGLVALLAGCAAPMPTPPAAPQDAPGPVLARYDDFAVVVVQRGDDLATLAERYLGDRQRAWWIAEFNGIERVTAGQEVVIPLRPRNAVGVHGNGFQTIPILCYHRFGNARSKLTVTPAAFEAQMEYLARNGYRVLPLADLPAFLQGREPLPAKTVVITIDDGYRSNYDIAFPILRKYGFPATIFLYSDFVGASDAMSWAQMKEMVASGLIEVQPHSKTHANLTLRLPGETDAKYRERIRREVEAPTALIKDRLGLVSVTFAYPYGDVNEMVIELLGQQGIKLGATVTPGGNGFFAPPHMLRRTMIFGNEDLDVFKSKLATFTRATAR
jgi:peptidoglycan/xylan/chitin deacetylase (PgdA/CDA1 family)